MTRPYWLVLGQSINKGWKATVDGSGKDLGPATLVDGFGNGWLVQPTGATTMAVTLRWTPQTGENVALLVSALAVVACLFLVLGPLRRRRGVQTAAPADGGRMRRWPRRRQRAAVSALEGDDVPALGNPFATARRCRRAWRRSSAAVCGLGAGILVPQAVFFAVFLGVAVGVAVALHRAANARAVGSGGGGVRRWRASIYTHRLAEDPALRLGSVADALRTGQHLVWMAIVFLGADAVVELVRRRRTRRARPAGARPEVPLQRRASASSTRALQDLGRRRVPGEVRARAMRSLRQASGATRCR